MAIDPRRYASTLWKAIKGQGDVQRALEESSNRVVKLAEDLKAELANLQAIPSGMIAFFLTDTPPSGWEEVTELRGAFPRGMPEGGTPGTTGGSNTHNHGNDTGENKASAYNIEFAAGTIKAALARHNHDHGMPSDSNLPPYVDGIWCRKL